MSDPVELLVDGPDGSRAVRVTNPDRLSFPALGVTKLDVVRYFLSVGQGILAALRDRPTMLQRMQGERGQVFFQRRVPRGAPRWVASARLAARDGTALDVVCPTELAVVAWAANLGTLAFHPWPVRRADVDRPDQLLIDLDPQPGTGFTDASRVAIELRGLLAEHGMDGFPKTSGGRGLHVIVPIDPCCSWTEARRAHVALGRELVRRMPAHATVELRKRDRGPRVYVDCNPQTVASAYSIRPGDRALVSAPVTWDELSAVSPEDFDVTTMPARFAAAGDLHAGLAGSSFALAPLLELADRDER